jgi:hypothetical protein
MTGIDETMDLINFVEDMAKVIREAKADGKLDMFDAIKVLKLAPSFTAAMRGSDKIKEELADLTGEERDMLLAKLKEAMFLLIEAVT